MMYERMTDKDAVPNEAEIEKYIGENAANRLASLEEKLKKNYQLSRDLKFPFGNSYGWGYKYSHKSSHLCYAFFEKDAFTVTLQIGDKEVPLAESVVPSMLKKTQELWANRYPCGEQGGWVHYRVLSDEEIDDVVGLIAVRKKPSAR